MNIGLPGCKMLLQVSPQDCLSKEVADAVVDQDDSVSTYAHHLLYHIVLQLLGRAKPKEQVITESYYWVLLGTRSSPCGPRIPSRSIGMVHCPSILAPKPYAVPSSALGGEYNLRWK